MGYFQVDNDQFKIFLIWIQYARSQRRKWCYGVGLSVNILFPDHISECTCSIVFKFYTSRRCMNFDLLLVQNSDLFRRFETHLVSGADRKLLGRLQSYCTYMISKVPSYAFSGFWTLKLTQHFDLIYNIGKFDWKILRNITKTAQGSYTITIKQIVRFHERMHLEKFPLDQIQNGR